MDGSGGGDVAKSMLEHFSISSFLVRLDKDNDFENYLVKSCQVEKEEGEKAKTKKAKEKRKFASSSNFQLLCPVMYN